MSKSTLNRKMARKPLLSGVVKQVLNKFKK